MAPKKTSKGKYGFFHMRAKPSGNFGVEFSHVGQRWCIGMYPPADEVACAYDVAVWPTRRLKMDLNFPEVESQAVAEWLVPQGIWMEEISAKKAKKRPAVVVAPSERDEATMPRFAREHPQYVQAELEHYSKRDVNAKRKG
ncbi:AP2-containing protein [Hordeum vulgare]|nr:AP2-containing protein [Hordeum vulgare]